MLTCLSCAIVWTAGAAFQAGATGASDAAPELLFFDGESLMQARTLAREGDPALKPAYDRLLADAGAALNEGPFSVAFKDAVPPSGDKRDYMSQGPYWWPNPDTPDGLPYVRRDGERNPEATLDRPALSAMQRAVNTLALAYFYSGAEEYAEHAAELVRTWFLDEETRMNPHLRYGQRIPGITEGRGIGIIDTARLPRLVDSVALLRGSKAWTAEDDDAFRLWVQDYLDWLIESPHGRDEARQPNNHGTWYDVQVTAFALFTGNTGLARRVLDECKTRRIASHIQPDGSQPHELARTLPHGYSVYNLEGFLDLATLGGHVGMDLWNVQPVPEAGSIRDALDYLAQFASGAEAWPHGGLTPPNHERLRPLLRRAAIAYEEPVYESLGVELGDGADSSARVHLEYPWLQPAQ